MKREVFDCDGCGRQDIGPGTYDLPVAEFVDPVDSKTHVSVKPINLCVNCKAWAWDQVGVQDNPFEGERLDSLLMGRRRGFHIPPNEF